MKINKIMSALLNIICLSFFILGKSAHTKNKQQQDIILDTHVHGLSELMVVIEADILEIQLLSPTINLIGFEHKASTPKEVAMVNSVKALLSNAASLFSLSGGDCSLINTEVDISSLSTTDDGHAHLPKHHQQQGNEHSEQHESDENHTQVVANYRYRCEERLSAITVSAFKQFSGIDKIRAIWITDTQQGAVMLSAEDKVIGL